MGVLTDFVVADRADAKRVGDCQNPSRELGGIDANTCRLAPATFESSSGICRPSPARQLLRANRF